MKNSAFKALRDRSGLSLLIVVIVISAVAILLTMTAGFIGIDSLQTGVRQDTTFGAFVGADSCMEIALKKLHDNSNYVGETVTIGETICIVTVTGSGTTRTIEVNASHSASAYTRKIRTSVDFTTKYQVVSWQELTE